MAPPAYLSSLNPRRRPSALVAALALATLMVAGGATHAAELKTAVFAGGCFWCMEPPYDELDGVVATTSGYSGGHAENPTYEQVTYGDTGHLEVVKVTYDPDKVDYATLLEVYWRNVDPFDNFGQFCDKGASYRAAIFVDGDAELALADRSKQALQEKLGKRIVVRILPRAAFYDAEDYHQDYYLKNPLRYKYYRFRCRRDARLAEVWGTKSE